jgi:DNA modification methylase
MQPSQLAEWVTFVPNKEKPVHNWFYYKEGYSEELVKWALGEFKLEGPVLDPFCGVGTTLLACKKKGLSSIGCDVSPLAVLASKAKTRNYDLEELQNEFERFKQLKPKPIERVPLDPRIRKLFYHEALETVWFYKNEIERIENEKNREFFLLALIDTTGRVANVIKVGGSLRKQKKPGMPVQKLLMGKIQRMLLDLKKSGMQTETGFPQEKFPEPIVLQQDARQLELEPESIGSAITSPPYLNKIEYTTVYKMELGIFFGEQETKLRAFMGDAPKEPIAEFAELPLIAQAYLADLKKVLQNVFVALKPNGKAVFNIAGGCFPHGPVQSDEYLEKIAKEIGFEIEKNITARKIWCHSEIRSQKTGQTKEAIVVLKKPAASV